MVAHRRERRRDLEALEKVLGALLPESSTTQFRQDIHHLRRQGEPKPPEFYATSKALPRSGGVPESEETSRMRAATEYLRSKGSSCPFRDLADFWTECARKRGGNEEYHPDSLRSRLRKGRHDLHGEGFVLLECWWDIYHSGDLRIVFPGKFPLSRELRELENRAGNLVAKEAGVGRN
jgi:hypothetical protein